MQPDNPIGIQAIDHLEFTSEQPNENITPLFKKLGFQISEKSTNTELFTQGQIRFALTQATNDQRHASQYFHKHGEGVSKISFEVQDVEKALENAVARGATEFQNVIIEESEHGIFKTAAIRGFGDVINEFVQRPVQQFRPSFKKHTDPQANALKTRVSRIDHLTNNVPKGEMDHWVHFYKTIYGFKETRYFDIKGVKTGLQSKVVQLTNNAVIIPINEPEEHHGKSQIQEFLDRHKGAGVQHIALMTPNALSTCSELRERGIKFLDIPHTYYEDIPNRPFKITEDLDALEQAQLLVDGDSEGYLIQNFTDTYIGPLFFEFIQRKNHWGFGEGNFQALFDAIERDQQARGYLK